MFKSIAIKKIEHPIEEPPFKPGDRFTYLGVPFVCVGNYAMYYEGMKVVIANYFDQSGNLKEEIFAPRSFPALREENKRIIGGI